MSMSVLQNPVRVMKTLIVPTVTVLTAVLVNKDLLEMGQLVMVCLEIKPCNRSMNVVFSQQVILHFCFL